MLLVLFMCDPDSDVCLPNNAHPAVAGTNGKKVFKNWVEGQAEPEIVLWGASWCGDCIRSTQFLNGNKVSPF